jgi:hypothetical protein
MSSDYNITIDQDSYLKKWHRSTDSRKSFAKRGDKIASFASIDGKVNDVIAPISGNIISCLFEIESLVKAGEIIAVMRACEHPALFNYMCVSCGDIVRIATPATSSSSSFTSPTTTMTTTSATSAKESAAQSSRVNILSSGSQLQLTKSEAQYLQRAKQTGLRAARKLALVLDLDHTLIHAAERGWPATPEENDQGISTVSLEVRHSSCSN